MNVLIADDKFFNVKSIVSCRIQAFNNIVNFYREENNG